MKNKESLCIRLCSGSIQDNMKRAEINAAFCGRAKAVHGTEVHLCLTVLPFVSHSDYV